MFREAASEEETVCMSVPLLFIRETLEPKLARERLAEAIRVTLPLVLTRYLVFCTLLPSCFELDWFSFLSLPLLEL